MNWKPKLNSDLLVVLLGLIIIIGAFVSFNPNKSKQDNISLDIVEPKIFKELTYEELSPDGLNKIISYRTIFDINFYRDYYEEYFDNNIIISIRDMEDGRESYIFTGGRLGEPKWLGNEHVFFTSYCGSSCQGIYLVNVFNKETKIGVLSYMTQGDDKPIYTHFKDWHDHEFEFDGWVDDIRSETIKNKAYLIFHMRDNEHKSVRQKKFLFTGNALKE